MVNQHGKIAHGDETIDAAVDVAEGGAGTTITIVAHVANAVVISVFLLRVEILRAVVNMVSHSIIIGVLQQIQQDRNIARAIIRSRQIIVAITVEIN